MWRREQNTAEKRVVREEATMWTSHVNAITFSVGSHFGRLRFQVRLTRPNDDDRSGGAKARTGSATGGSIAKVLEQSLSLLLSCCLVLATAPVGLAAQTDSSTASTPVQAAQQTPEQLQQLVAPIALYPDALVAQVLAAATYPDQIVEAD